MNRRLVSLAAVLVTTVPGAYLLTGDPKPYATLEACTAAASQGLGVEPRHCKQVIDTEIRGDCSDVPAPDFEATQSYAYCPGEKYARIGTSSQEHAGYPTCWQIVITPDVPCSYHPAPEEPGIFWEPKVVPDSQFIEAPYPGPLANPQTPPADDPTGTSNTDPPVKGQWTPLQAAP